MMLVGFVTSLIVCFLGFCQMTQVLRPRGVPLSKKVFYDPARDFTCLDGSLSIPFVYVNDDYCDCQDGSDEPGTSACPNSLFHCPNLGFSSKDIPSSRVNDGICDCCDGSDEYNSSISCVDICSELGRGAYEAAKKLEEMYNKGSTIRQEMINNAQHLIQDNSKRLEELKQQILSVETNKNEKEAIKKSIEAKERSALDKFKAEQDAKRQAREQEDILNAQQEEKQNALTAFKELDSNQDGILTFSELQKFDKFDRDENGIVDDEEAKFFLHMKDEMDSEEFVNTGWMIMKPFYLKAKAKLPSSEDKVSEFGMPKPIVPDKLVESSQETDGEAEGDLQTEGNPVNEEIDEDDQIEDEGSHYTPPSVSEGEKDDAKEPEYDQETLKLIEESKEAKRAFSEIESKYLDLSNKIREIEVVLDADFGEEREFLPLSGQCFEYHDREYTYKLCPFDRALQIPKSGGFETNLGQWGKWVGPDGSKYEKMKYEGGATCWNGPARSTLVYLKCGLENKLVTVSEPNKCEYNFEFETPALCKVDKIPSLLHEHTEL